MKEDDIQQVVEFIHKGILLTQQAKTAHEAAVTAASKDGPPAKATTKVSLFFATSIVNFSAPPLIYTEKFKL